jgi:hypothetical protein
MKAPNARSKAVPALALHTTRSRSLPIIRTLKAGTALLRLSAP